MVYEDVYNDDDEPSLLVYIPRMGFQLREEIPCDDLRIVAPL